MFLNALPVLSVTIIFYSIISSETDSINALRYKRNSDPCNDEADIPTPPAVKEVFLNNDHVRLDIERWQPCDDNNIWELSGLFEGDILLDPDESYPRNFIDSKKHLWPKGTIPYYIYKEHFNVTEIENIKKAIDYFNKHTKLTIRPYRGSDENYVVFVGNYSGCWSYQGMRSGGQHLNLQAKSYCFRLGTVVHELLHAFGFAHQQSSRDRDKYIRVVWENIKKGKEHNFQKINNTLDFGVGYDYGSVMHYSKAAFSINKKPTLVPLEEGVKIGQRKGFSPKDIEKTNRMFLEKYCHTN